MKIFRKLFISVILPFAYVFAHGSNWHMMGWNHMYFGTGGAVMFILLFVLIAVGAYFILRNTNILKPDENITSLEILKKRYAKGEISKREFERMKKDLS